MRAVESKFLRLMRLVACLAAIFGAALLLVQQLTPGLRASEGRDFAGFYDLTNVITGGDPVSLTFSARVFNYSGSDVADATVTLRGPGAPGDAYATFYSVALPNGGSVPLSQAVTVPKQQYDSWLSGQSPLLVIDFQDANGDPQSKPVELTNQTVGQE